MAQRHQIGGALGALDRGDARDAAERADSRKDAPVKGTGEEQTGARADFSGLLPDAVLDAVERATGQRCSGVIRALPSYINTQNLGCVSVLVNAIVPVRCRLVVVRAE